MWGRKFSKPQIKSQDPCPQPKTWKRQHERITYSDDSLGKKRLGKVKSKAERNSTERLRKPPTLAATQHITLGKPGRKRK